MRLETPRTLRIVPLGGLGRIGGNMMAYETPRDLILVDCGMLFPTPEQPGVDYCIPKIDYVLERKQKLRAIVLTHGHEDHHGALPYLLPALDVPIYGTGFTLALAASKLAQFDLDLTPKLILIRDNEPFEIGTFGITPIPVTHSIPGAVLLAMKTPVGVVVHTGDFKLDPSPIDGRLTNVAALERLGDAGVVALLSDSTNAEKPGHTHSEGEVAAELERQIASAPFRVAVTTFASNIHRIQSIVDASIAAGRKVVLAGRSMQQNVQLALEKGFLRAPPSTFLDSTHYERVPRSRTTVLASGSQGEPESNMTRIAAGSHGDIRLEPLDRAILSSRRIPGNERAVGAVGNNFAKAGIEVIDDRMARVHASGHACNDEQRAMIDYLRPRFFIPLHGEYRQMARHAALAMEAGVRKDHVFILEDGQPLELVELSTGVAAQRAEPIVSGLTYVDGSGHGDVTDPVLFERRVLADAGVVACAVTVLSSGALVVGPSITARGLTNDDHFTPLRERAEQEVLAALARLTDRSPTAMREEMRVTLRRFFRRELDRRPMIVPTVMVLD